MPMEILLGTEGLSAPLPYLTTVFEHLERLGHEVLVFTAEEAAAPEGLRVASTQRGLPLAPDVIYAQDAYAALLLAEIYPLTPQVFALHDARDVAFDERGGDRARAASLVHEIVRLRRPVDTDRLTPLGQLRDRPRAVALHLEHLSDYRRGDRDRARRRLRARPRPADSRGDGVGSGRVCLRRGGRRRLGHACAVRAARSRRVLGPSGGERDRLRTPPSGPRGLRPGDGLLQPRAGPRPQRARPCPGAGADLRRARLAPRPGGRAVARARPARAHRSGHGPLSGCGGGRGARGGNPGSEARAGARGGARAQRAAHRAGCRARAGPARGGEARSGGRPPEAGRRPRAPRPRGENPLNRGMIYRRSTPMVVPGPRRQVTFELRRGSAEARLQRPV